MSISERTKNALLIIGSILFSILLLEFGLRIFWRNPYFGTFASRVVEIRLNAPNISAVFNRAWLDPTSPLVRFRTNSDGYILPSLQNARPQFTIAFLGGSTTECSYVAEDLRFPALVATLMKPMGLTVNTINAGRSGNTVHDTLNILLNQLVLRKPDYVVLMEAINDIGVLDRDANYGSRMAIPVSSRMQAKWMFQNASNYSALIGYIRQLATAISNATHETVGTVEMPINVPPLLGRELEDRYRAQLQIFIATARALGSTPVLMTQPLARYRNTLTPGWVNNHQQARFNDIIREIAVESGVLQIDLAAMALTLPGFAKEPEKFLYDGLHATDDMSRIYAKKIVENLQPLLVRAPMFSGQN